MTGLARRDKGVRRSEEASRNARPDDRRTRADPRRGPRDPRAPADRALRRRLDRAAQHGVEGAGRAAGMPPTSLTSSPVRARPVSTWPCSTSSSPARRSSWRTRASSGRAGGRSRHAHGLETVSVPVEPGSADGCRPDRRRCEGRRRHPDRARGDRDGRTPSDRGHRERGEGARDPLHRRRHRFRGWRAGRRRRPPTRRTRHRHAEGPRDTSGSWDTRARPAGASADRGA